MLITYLPQVSHRIYNLISLESSFAWSIVHTIFFSMNGLVNFIIYGINPLVWSTFKAWLGRVGLCLCCKKRVRTESNERGYLTLGEDDEEDHEDVVYVF